MRPKRPRAAAAAAAMLLAGVWAAPAEAAAALEVSPVLLDVLAPGATGTVNLKNDDARPTTLQVRLFHWVQAGGQERYEPTQDVVASPPIATVQPGATLTVRVIRAAETPVKGEESYRLVVDQLPEADRSGRAKVSMLLRQVLPVFFAEPDRSAPQITWSLARGAKGYELRAHNEGDQRLRVARVTLSGAGGGTVTLGGGLLGYVLGHADMSWTIGKAIRPGATVTLRCESDHGDLRATAPVSAAR